MEQFEFNSAAALDRLEKEELFGSWTGELASNIALIGGILAELAGASSAAAFGHLYETLRGLAAGKDESNLVYFGRAVVVDIRRLYRLSEEVRRAVEENLKKKEAGEVLANATLYVPRTNVESRIRRLAHIFANGVRTGKHEPESTDDMLRAVVELKEADVIMLGKIYESQSAFIDRQLRQPGSAPTNWHGEIPQIWREFVDHGGLNPQEHLRYRSSLARLASLWD